MGRREERGGRTWLRGAPFVGNGWTGLDWRMVALPALPEPHGPVVLRVGVGERWCATCGEVIGPWMEMSEGRRVRCCGNPRPIAVRQVLWPEEFAEAR